MPKKNRRGREIEKGGSKEKLVTEVAIGKKALQAAPAVGSGATLPKVATGLQFF